jgi:hypothetical protein
MADINIYGAVRSMAGDGKAAYASQVWDERQKKFQSQINEEAANDGLVSAKETQSFTDTEKGIARSNIDAYKKPNSGIPKTDMTDGIQNSLEKADGALQEITEEEFNQIFD